ncbi:MAG: NAD-dependent epimerase/dehydratase family protein [Planctomycetaceae bacterium]|jgi:nucleoside-diphosphate-sugar epimerase|nr:NAD-dependent epimerase/dehydratase family protein [Planctomycetaceae bacterium]
MKVLFIGGNGNISWYCVQESLQMEHEVWILNRNATSKTRRDIQPEVHKLNGDIRNRNEITNLLKNKTFDVVADFICYNKEHAELDIELFRDKTKQFIFISSESVYKRESKNLPYQENCPQNDPFSSCSYIAGKILAEQTFLKAYQTFRFPVTIVRPGYTYDTIVPVALGGNCFTAPNRFIHGKPVLIAGDGTNLWTFTHSSDFASAFVKLLGNRITIGEAFHITSDEWLTWNEMTHILLDTLNIKYPQYIHIPFQAVLHSKLAVNQKDMLYQKMWHNIYDLSKIRQLIPDWKIKVPFKQGIKQTIDWLYEDKIRCRINTNLDELLEELTIKYKGQNYET